MHKTEAINIIERTFSNSFAESEFTLFIKNLLNDIDTTKYNEYRGNLIKDSFKDHIRQYKRIGKYTDPKGESLDVLVIEVKDQTKLDKARTSLRNFVINHLENFEKDYALAAFYSNSDHGADWRFSYVKLEYKTEVSEGKLKQSKELTPAKRYSFLVGKHEQAHTAKKQLLPLLENIYNNPTIEELEEAFSIEKVTDEFFEQYKGLFIKLSEHFEHDTNGLKEQLAEADIDIPRFTKKLLGQIVFLYFIQKKGWLGVPKNEKWGKGDKKYLQNLYYEAVDNGHNFFGYYLQRLFYKALAHKHADKGIPGYYKKLHCKVPFLNGGLFEADYDWKNSGITIPNDLFRNQEKVKKSGDIGTGVLDVFDRYNFTIKEDEPLEKEVAVDPEMLGKVFENMLEVTERKSKGAFYTPREIVHYMCQESLIHYLDNSINDNPSTYLELGGSQVYLVGNEIKYGQKSLMSEQKHIIVPKEDIDIFIRKGFFALENDQRVLREGKETKTYRFQLPESIRLNADLIDKKLADIKICDPAIGSGAFPVGMLHELVNAQLVLKQYISNKYLKKKLEILNVTKEEIDEQSDKYNYRLKRHTIQESIYGVDIDASATDIARLRMWLSLVVDEEDLDNIEALPNLDYKIVCGNSLVGLPENAMRDLNVEKELEDLKEEFFLANDELYKKDLRTKINGKIRQLLSTAEAFAGYKIDFDYKLYFSEVWHYNGGFDIVIGNPPWLALIGKQLKKYKKVDESKNLKIYKSQYIFNSYMPNLYEFFLQKAYRITKERGILNFIIPDRFGFNESSVELRNFFIKNSILKEIVYKWNFPQIITDTMTFVCQKSKPTNDYGFLIKNDTHSVSIPYKLSEITDDSELIFRSFDSLRTKSLINRVKKNSIPLINHAKSTSGFGALAGLVTKMKENERQMPVLKGSSIGSYVIKEPFYFEFKGENIGGRTRDESKLSIKNKVLLRKTGFPIICAYDKSGYYPEQSLYFFYSISNLISNEFLLLLFNSSLYNWYYKNYLVTNLDSTPQLKNKDLDVFPLRIPSNIEIYNKIGCYIYFLEKTEVSNLIVKSFFKDLSDAMVFELFFPSEIKSAEKEILIHLQGLESISEKLSDAEKLAVINIEFQRLYDPNHPVRNNVETLDSVEEVRIIKDALK
ncbi:hypothetical protein D1614_22760 [Maribellus luteus]|uniref:site-specific DNA-methyltransferase (adenine-specific) n=1 Tax=Maribellus luteus TaxID=2305463 RepID=A0A399SU67_9BACT|nr:TaqI-like C-terminal specificity domain-containing protein [Maribellus luteus]RIJ45495.1 hypothetical protein D1614_22760 [Maribellus luteus]